ncbi:MAG: protein kinase domain-containing protein [Acidobacteriota bacterium]
MADQPASARGQFGERIVVWIVLVLGVWSFAMQPVWVRPYILEAGTTLIATDSSVFASLGQPPAVARTRPPRVADLVGQRVALGSRGDAPAGGESVAEPLVIGIVGDDGDLIDLSKGLPAESEGVLRFWRAMYRLGPRAPITLVVSSGAGEERRTLRREAIWRQDSAAVSAWLGVHAGALLWTAAFLGGAFVLAALGTRGRTATLMTLALIAAAVANSGTLNGAEFSVPIVGPVLLVYGWLVTPLAFPLIGLAVLHFPSRAPALERYGWVYPALAAATLPMLVISLLSAGFLLGLDLALSPLAALTQQGWLFDVSFALALSANVAIVIEGMFRYRRNPDIGERRRIQIVVYTGVPAVFAYAIRASVPLMSSLFGPAASMPWWIDGPLHAIVLLPAVGLPYAVAVKRVFSPRTVIRRGVQYALAQRTLSLLIALPIGTLLVSLFTQRDRPLSAVIWDRPAFYALGIALVVLALRYRAPAQRWLDQRFFRAEYDARQILASLANRLPYEPEPSALVTLVLTQLDTALHPESVAVLAGAGARFDLASGLRSSVGNLPRDGALATLLRWSDEPLEVFLDDERSPVARLPPSDRQWLDEGRVALLVPILAGTGDLRTLNGLIALGAKRSEEPYTAEDRELLTAIAAQMSVALDLSSLRRRLSSTPSELITSEVRSTPGSSVQRPAARASVDRVPTTVGVCPACQRCVELTDVPPGCPEHPRETLEPLVGVPKLVDGKYRLDTLVGRGGMGDVVRARDMRLDRDVAIKTVKVELLSDGNAMARFDREARVVARLQHPGLVTVFDYGTFPHGGAFLVMEFIDGEDLRRVLGRDGPLDVERVVGVVDDVAAAVDAAHKAGVLHRDLKPENIMLPAGGGAPKVMDFGVAKLTKVSSEARGGTITMGTTIIGTPAYMAPEQLKGETLDARADVYSLAVVTYELLTGRLPFGTGSPVEIGIRQAAQGHLNALEPLPIVVRQAIVGALSLDRHQRPDSAGAFARALRVTPATPPAP